MGIVDDDVARVRELTDLAELVGEHMALKRAGRRFVGLCPFHTEKTPSFSVNPELGVYYCFGCQASGDAITFVREVEHLDFVGAVERLASRVGMTLRYDDSSQGRDRRRAARLAEAVGSAIDFYHRILVDDPAGGEARRYLRSRGFDGDAARRFRLGFAPGSFDALTRHLHRKGFSRDEMITAGLSFTNRAQRLQDQFRDRLMFPIHDSRGEPAGFGGRALVAGAGPKYKNSPETPLYHKSRMLYWLHEAKADIVASGGVVVCEGYTDVMALVLSGVPQAVATCGTAVTDDHVRALTKLARRVTLAYDADSAGQAAAERWYAWEQEHEVEVRVAALPAGRDPAEVWAESPDALRRAIDDAVPFLAFRLNRVLAGADLSTVEGRARAANSAVDVIAQHPSDLVRDQYVMQISGQVGIEPERIRAAVDRIRRQPGGGPARPADRAGPERRNEGVPRAPGAARPGDGRRDRPGGLDATGGFDPAAVDPREADALRFAQHDAGYVVDWLAADLFGDPVAREVFEILARTGSAAEALESADGPARSLLQRLAVEEPLVDAEPETVEARLMANLAEPAGRRRAERLVASDRAEEAAEGGRLLDALANARGSGWPAAREPAERLLAWLAAGSQV